MTDVDRPPLTFAFFPDVAKFDVASDDVADGEMLGAAQVANFMGYSGQNLSPQLSWTGFPAETKSFAVTVHDPDAPTGSGFWHWLVVNIPASVNELATGAGSEGSDELPEGALQLRNDAGTRGYAGAAPPTGDRAHRYVHTVHALDVERLDVEADSSAAIAGFNLRFHAIARAQIVPIFGS
ncbi:MAG TPA: YbhB/YbcL family Raf kinase inhibitor-like protein [Acidimicrobiales bacterium]|nr:YbhB/YbcL family Raf kinase inhibitor-like protein [Acidimicrobiales bacterium]